MKLILIDIGNEAANGEGFDARLMERLDVRKGDADVKVVLVSEGSLEDMQGVAERANLSRLGGLLMANDGALLVDCASGRRVLVTAVQPTVMPDMYMLAEKYKVEVQMLRDGDDILRVIVGGDSERLKDFEAEASGLMKDVMFDNTKADRLEIMQKTATREVCLKRLCGLLGVESADVEKVSI